MLRYYHAASGRKLRAILLYKYGGRVSQPGSRIGSGGTSGKSAKTAINLVYRYSSLTFQAEGHL